VLPFYFLLFSFFFYPKTIAAAIALPIEIPDEGASSQAGAELAPVDVNNCPSVP
jgi:hypothetical protein